MSYLAWILYLLPLAVVVHRGMVLEARTNAYRIAGLKKEKLSYPSGRLLLGFMPLVNIPVALLVLKRARRERFVRGYIKPCVW